VQHFIALPKKGGPELELTSRYRKNSNTFSFGNNPHSTPNLYAKTFAGQYANKRRGAIEDGGLFVTANYWGFLPESRLNDWTENKTENAGTFTLELGNIKRFGGFKFTRRMRTGYGTPLKWQDGNIV